MKKLLVLFFGVIMMLNSKGNPVDRLLERIDKGASQKFKLELLASPVDFFELDQDKERVVIRANNYVNMATGLNWYLKYYAGIHLTWNNMKTKLPEQLPVVNQKERRETDLLYRYDLNYCTYSYSMAFWDWERWEQEIDWMALHGVNLPLAITGVETVWRNVLKQLGYDEEAIGRFIAGPGFLAWWYMNNLEGWGGPAPESWYKQQTQLQHKILNRMEEFGMQPVFPGYCGMLPSDAGSRLGVEVADPGAWCGFRRPAFIQPTDPAFQRIAALYYAELRRQFGKARFYSMDPFHEGGNTKGVDLAAAGQAIVKAMKQNNPEAVWVVQAWQANPQPTMIEEIQIGDLLILDLSSENRPMWGDKVSPWYRENGYGQHHWMYCMLLNFGGNVGMYGKMDRVIQSFYDAKAHPAGKTQKGVGITMEGIENNPVMYELLLELPWRAKRFAKEEWVCEYAKARYGTDDKELQNAWRIMAETVYHCPGIQEGTTESVFCARPAEEVHSASSWGTSQLYYLPEELRKAAESMLKVAEQYRGNRNFEYDLIDVIRQTVADRGNGLLKEVTAAYRKGDKMAFKKQSDEFLNLILCQDRLLATCSDFRLGKWLQRARKLGTDPEEQKWYEWNARTLITVWGNREAANGGLRDYAHREWAGLLRDFYYPRWEAWFDYLQARLEGKNPPEIDWFAMEEPWTRQQNEYLAEPQGDPITIAQEVYNQVFR